MRLAVEDYSLAFPECKHLLEALYEEVDKPRYGGEYEPDEYEYRGAYTQWGSFVIVAYDDSGAPVGILGVIQIYSMHNSLSIVRNDVFYVMPEYRFLGVAARMMRMAERIAADRGFDLFSWDVPQGSLIAKALAARPEYRHESVSFVKDLNEH